MVKRRLFLIVLAVGLLGVYYFLDPTHSRFALKCPFKFLTGWDCPGCGSQRALHAVLHGGFVRALRYNPFMVISIPYLLTVAYTTFFRDPFALKCRRVVQHKNVVMTIFFMIIGWWILRNTPWWNNLGIEL